MFKRLLPLVLLSTAVACSGSDEKKAEASPGAVTDGCTRDALESDLLYLPLTGAQVNDSGELAAPGDDGYVVSSTFLRLRPGDATTARFTELFGPIAQILPTQPGLQAFQLATSASCGTARTLSVWESTEAMYDFVGSDAHSTAANAVTDVSRGGSVVVHWSAASAADASWNEATRQLAAAQGPFY